ncbi:hypothetical protein F511_27697 [Dorcoceras hygrometricum]|uniref:Uncharacterized protein n=1 Tax=Dorcoceras hygrometricum TaxID=472368 RepID=A0A2Z7CGZ6_9LAMI|nr:hypothetical protein F511_27697 [Dorcoceras hygrometricum]
MSTSQNKIPLFSREDYDDCEIRMQAHLAAMDDEMWTVITEAPLKIMKPNLAFAVSNGEPQFLEKARHEYTNDDKKKANLDNVARDILYKTLDKDKNMFSKIKTCATTKDIWEKLVQIYEGSDETKENKLTVAQQKLLRQSGPRPDPRLLRQAALEALTRSARTDSPRRTGRKQISDDDRRRRRVGGGGGGVF